MDTILQVLQAKNHGVDLSPALLNKQLEELKKYRKKPKVRSCHSPCSKPALHFAQNKSHRLCSGSQAQWDIFPPLTSLGSSLLHSLFTSLTEKLPDLLLPEGLCVGCSLHWDTAPPSIQMVRSLPSFRSLHKYHILHESSSDHPYLKLYSLSPPSQYPFPILLIFMTCRYTV